MENIFEVPAWFYKLSPGVVVCIGFFVSLHVVALIAVAYFYSTRKESPDFKSKLK